MPRHKEFDNCKNAWQSQNALAYLSTLLMTTIKCLCNIGTCGQFNKHFTSVTYGPSKVSCTVHSNQAPIQCYQNALAREHYTGKYHCTVDLLFDLFVLVCFTNKNENCQLSYSWFQTSQAGGQQYSDTCSLAFPAIAYLATGVIYACKMFIRLAPGLWRSEHLPAQHLSQPHSAKDTTS
jgi:hypothetical protein